MKSYFKAKCPYCPHTSMNKDSIKDHILKEHGEYNLHENKVRAIRVKWTAGVNGRIIYHPYSNASVESVALVTPKQLAYIKRNRNKFLNVQVLSTNVIVDESSLWKGLSSY